MASSRPVARARRRPAVAGGAQARGREPDADLGAHVSVAGGLDTCFDRAAEETVRNVQIFLKNQRQWAARPLSPPEVARFRTRRRRFEGAILAHSTYLVNLGAADGTIYEKSVATVIEELSRVHALAMDGLVIHPGSSRISSEAGIERACAAFDRILSRPETGGARVLLETTAGGGGSIGGRFEHLRALLEGVDRRTRRRLGVCVDTCHLHVAGYDIVSDAGWEETLAALGEAVGGLEAIEAIHLNDSVAGRGSRRDHHANLGRGTLGLRVFERLLHDRRFDGVPKLLETPREDDGRMRDLALLRAMRGTKHGPSRRKG